MDTRRIRHRFSVIDGSPLCYIHASLKVQKNKTGKHGLPVLKKVGERAPDEQPLSPKSVKDTEQHPLCTSPPAPKDV